jgi:hypothetical protein
MHLVVVNGSDGAMPASVASDAATRKMCLTCGTDLEARQSEFDRGAKHALNVLYRKLVERDFTDDLAAQLVLWVQSDIEL